MDVQLDDLLQQDLRDELKARQVSSAGLKATLLTRLIAELVAEGASEDAATFRPKSELVRLRHENRNLQQRSQPPCEVPPVK